MSTILIVDDDPDIRFTFATLLGMHNFKVLTLPEGKNIFETLKNNNVDLIILDIILPEESGIEILSKIKNHEEFKYIPVIMFTAKDSEQTLKEAFESGANDFIAKPVKSVTELIARINAHIKIKKYEDGLRKINLEKQLEILKQIMVTIEHSLGQPLTVIFSYLSILEKEALKNPDFYSKFSPIFSKMKNSTEEIKNTVEKLKGITNIEITQYVQSIKMLKIEDTKKDRD
ncbi:two-component system response regulator [Thermotomaculum hydrothermale]|uniref:Two-component system response regulator n=1 Tax=Thermotomaculum hydrothermale TaxID=981385 RepID=A0A7R6SYR8_9BACT|nr:response regulator [Thermotomaculum hydrothermale]BBB32950.1 two-component system response regulator [Thermotomaculum hydrothermale]